MCWRLVCDCFSLETFHLSGGLNDWTTTASEMRVPPLIFSTTFNQFQPLITTFNHFHLHHLCQMHQLHHISSASFGLPWFFMVCHDLPWSSLYIEVPWSTLKYREVAWSNSKYFEVLWRTLKYFDVHWSTLKFRKVLQSSIEVHSFTPLLHFHTFILTHFYAINFHTFTPFSHFPTTFTLSHNFHTYFLLCSSTSTTTLSPKRGDSWDNFPIDVDLYFSPLLHERWQKERHTLQGPPEFAARKIRT